MIAHGINDDTTQLEIAQKVLATLESANKDLAKFIKKSDGVYTKQRYNEIRKYIKEIASRLQNDIDDDIDVDKYLQNELKEVEKIFNGTTTSNIKMPSLEQVKTASTFTPYTEKSTFDSFLDNINTQFFNTWDSAVRTGYMTGQTTQQIVKNVVGSVAKNAQVAQSGTIDSLKNSLVANTRTALQSFSVEARNEVYRKNDDLFDGYKWMASLDRRTCLVCGHLDGKIFRKLDDIGEMPPLHHNCRCTIVPYIKDFDEFESTRASEDGGVDSSVTYEDWLNSQNDNTKRKILGESRYNLYKSGALNGKNIEFVNNKNEIIPVDDLLKKYNIVADPKTQRPIPPSEFNAEKWSSIYKDARATSNKSGLNYMLNKFDNSDELIKKAKEVEEACSKLPSTASQFRISGTGLSSIYTKERQSLHEKIINDFIEEKVNAICPKDSTPKFIMLGGRGGSGKSSMNCLVYNSKDYLVIDADEIKKRLPEYKGWNASQVHDESGDIVKKLIDKASKANMNIVYDGTMGSTSSVMNVFEILNNNGKYYKEIDYLFLPQQVTFERAIERWRTNGSYSGRFVPMNVLLNMTKNESTFDEVKDFVDNWNFFSNFGVKYGDKPILISSKLS